METAIPTQMSIEPNWLVIAAGPIITGIITFIVLGIGKIGRTSEDTTISSEKIRRMDNDMLEVKGFAKENRDRISRLQEAIADVKVRLEKIEHLEFRITEAEKEIDNIIKRLNDFLEHGKLSRR